MSQSSGDILQKAWNQKCKASIWMNWMLTKKRIPREVLDFCIVKTEETLTLLKEIRDGAQK